MGTGKHAETHTHTSNLQAWSYKQINKHRHTRKHAHIGGGTESCRVSSEHPDLIFIHVIDSADSWASSMMQTCGHTQTQLKSNEEIKKREGDERWWEGGRGWRRKEENLFFHTLMRRYRLRGDWVINVNTVMVVHMFEKINLRRNGRG